MASFLKELLKDDCEVVKEKGGQARLRQKKKREAERSNDTSDDQDVIIALKKLRVDLEGNYLQQLPDRCCETPCHSTAEQLAVDSSQQLCEMWTKAMRKLSSSYERKGKKLNHRHHRTREKQTSPLADMKGNLNLAYAAMAHRPLVKEGRLKVAAGTTTTHTSAVTKPAQSVLRSPKFTFTKPAKLAGVKSTLSTISEPGEHTTNSDTSAKPNEPHANVNTSKSQSESASCSKDGNKDSSAPPVPQTVFGGAVNSESCTYSSLVLRSSKSAKPKNKEPEVFKFEGYRSSQNFNPSVHPTCSSASETASREDFCRNGFDLLEIKQSLQQVSSHTAVLQRSCSVEARQDESEYNVNELAGYFENLLFLPKDMSSMAQMMYI